MIAKSIAQSDAVLHSDFIALVTVKDRYIVWANSAMHSIFRYPTGSLPGLSTRQFFLDDAAYEAFGREAYAAIAANHTYTGMHEQLRYDGTTGWFQFNVSTLTGYPDTVVAATIDVSLNHEAEELLLLNQTVVQDQTEVISRFSVDGTFYFVNDVYCRTFGKSRDELIGHSWQPHACIDDLEMIEARLSSITPNHPVVTIENRVLVAEGVERWMQFVNRGSFDDQGNLTEIQSVGRDITELKQTELKLRESEDRLQLALNGSNSVLWDWHITEHKVIAGSGWLAILGYRGDELGDEEDRWMGLIHPDDLPAFEQKIQGHLQGDTDIFTSEHRLRHKQGHWIHVQAYGKVSRRDAGGNPLRMVGTVQDVTQIKRLNQEGVDMLRRIESLIRGHSPVVDQTSIETLASLTKRERQVLEMISQGLTSAQIAVELQIATATVVSHRQKMMAKLGLHSTAEVIRFAANHGLLQGQVKTNML